MLDNANWIWFDKNYDSSDTYGEFCDKFNISILNEIFIYIVADSNYNVYVNGVFAGFNNCCDYKTIKEVDRLDITKFCKLGVNEINIKVWYYGINYQTYIKDGAGVIYSIVENGIEINNSSKNTLSRNDTTFKNGQNKFITQQLGLSFSIDNTIKSLPFKHSIIVNKSKNFVLRKRRNLKLGKKIISYQKKENLYDFQKEVVGFFSCNIYSEIEQKVIISFGEHLDKNENVPRQIESRDFSFEIFLKKGQNMVINTFRRLALRYIQIQSDNKLNVIEIAILPVFYPTIIKEFHTRNVELQKIYDTSIYTLQCCMHEHFEDCPWREQALYTMDSRNQILCNYYGLNNNEYVRYNLVFMARGLREDGLLSICFPSGFDIPIPSFSLIYIKMISEYLKNTNDYTILDETIHVIKKIFKAFFDKIDKNNLIPSFGYPCWNFYEWTNGSDRENEICRKATDGFIYHYDLIINCMFLYILPDYEFITGEKIEMPMMYKAIKQNFYQEGFYKLSTIDNRGSQLGNAFAILCGLEKKEFALTILNNKNLIPCSLSMKIFLYDAIDEPSFIINDIKNSYGKMLENGATTFWETEKGCLDFNGAGSLCHGWSAIPIVYFNKYKDYIESLN